MCLAVVFVVMGYIMVRAPSHTHTCTTHAQPPSHHPHLPPLKPPTPNTYTQPAPPTPPTTTQPTINNTKHIIKRTTHAQGESWRLRAASERELRRRIERRADEILAEFQETYRCVLFVALRFGVLVIVCLFVCIFE